MVILGIRKQKVFIDQENGYYQVYIRLTDKEIEEIMILLTEMKFFGEPFTWKDESPEHDRSRVDVLFQKVNVSPDGEVGLTQEGSNKIHHDDWFFWLIIFLALLGLFTVLFIVWAFLTDFW